MVVKSRAFFDLHLLRLLWNSHFHELAQLFDCAARFFDTQSHSYFFSANGPSFPKNGVSENWAQSFFVLLNEFVLLLSSPLLVGLLFLEIKRHRVFQALADYWLCLLFHRFPILFNELRCLGFVGFKNIPLWGMCLKSGTQTFFGKRVLLFVNDFSWQPLCSFCLHLCFLLQLFSRKNGFDYFFLFHSIGITDSSSSSIMIESGPGTTRHSNIILISLRRKSLRNPEASAGSNLKPRRSEATNLYSGRSSNNLIGFISSRFCYIPQFRTNHRLLRRNFGMVDECVDKIMHSFGRIEL